MKHSASLLAIGAALLLASAAQAVTFNYANEPGSAIVFDGAGGFSFTPGTNSFEVTSGSASGFLGEIGGSFSIGAITTTGLVSTAAVSGSGTFVIHDGAFDLSGNLSWVDISQIGTAGGLNTVGSVNLTSLTYGGVNPDLIALRDNVTAYNVLTFQFAPARSLAELKASAASTSFSGTITTVTPGGAPGVGVPDRGPAVALLGLALACLAFFGRKLAL